MEAVKLALLTLHAAYKQQRPEYLLIFHVNISYRPMLFSTLKSTRAATGLDIYYLSRRVYIVLYLVCHAPMTRLQ